jgi:hypothetical protein
MPSIPNCNLKGTAGRPPVLTAAKETRKRALSRTGTQGRDYSRIFIPSATVKIASF